MKCILLIFLIEIALLSLIPIDVESAEFASLVIVSLNSILLSCYIVLSKSIKFKNIITVSLILKLFILFVSYYSIFPVMFTGADSVRFDTQAFQMWQNPNLLSHKYGTLYQPFLGYMYYIIGPQKMIAQYFNLVLSTFGLIFIDRLLCRFGIGNKSAMICMVILSLSPVAIILSSVLMIDALVTNFFIFSVCFFLFYIQEKRIIHVILSLLFLLLASAFHSGVFVFIIGIIGYIFIEKDKNSVWVKILCILIITIGIYSFSDALFSKFSGLEKSESEIMEQLADARGGSAYLTGLKSDSIGMNLLFFPIKAIYFLFSPIPWDIRHLGDVIMLLLDSVLYYYVITQIIRARHELMNCDIRKYMIIGIVFVLFAFANGTHNTGTAARHRYKILPVLCMVYILYNKKDKNDES